MSHRSLPPSLHYLTFVQLLGATTLLHASVGHTDIKGRTFVLFGRKPDFATRIINNRLYQIQPQTRTFSIMHFNIVGPEQLAKNLALLLRGYAQTSIFDDDLRTVTTMLQTQYDPTGFRRVFNGVRGQVLNNDTHKFGVDIDDWDVGIVMLLKIKLTSK